MEITVSADRGAAYDLLSSHQAMGTVVPNVILSVRVLSVRPETYVAEERLRLGGRLYVTMVRHRTDPRRLTHHYFVIGGDAKGSQVTEWFRDAPGGTQITAHIRWKAGLRGIVGGSVRRSYQEILNAAKVSLES